METDAIFDTKQRIKMGIWGLGRGLSFFKNCKALNIDVVAGCDYNRHMRDRFAEMMPDAFVTEDEDVFLEQDFDAVLLATYCPDHGPEAVRCLETGKHVLSEVTAFHTPAEGVRLVEAVEKTGRIYNLAENCPFTAPNMLLAHHWREGLFGEMMYAEYEYVHECRSLVYTYIDGVPVQPGHTVHNWRSWLHFHYYNTHSLGPVMHITGARPVRVVALRGAQGLAGYPVRTPDGMKGIAPSLITMDNGGLMRNLMGATTSDGHHQRLWGTRGAAEIGDGKLFYRLGASGKSPQLEIEPRWPELSEWAAKTGHGGGDFWVLYYFARNILYGEPAPFDVYNAADCTLPGILAYRSTLENGAPQDVPDFREKVDRDRHREDHFAQKRFDVKNGMFPKSADPKAVGGFTTVMKELIPHATAWRAYADYASILTDVKNKQRVVELADQVIERYPEMKKAMQEAEKIASAHPRSTGARVLREMLELADPNETLKNGFLARLKKRRAELAKEAEKGG
ncbi:hypothetical protein HQ520_01660 [bacterium]|nr:hypothetical protein [bacterium]